LQHGDALSPTVPRCAVTEDCVNAFSLLFKKKNLEKTEHLLELIVASKSNKSLALSVCSKRF